MQTNGATPEHPVLPVIDFDASDHGQGFSGVLDVAAALLEGDHAGIALAEEHRQWYATRTEMTLRDAAEGVALWSESPLVYEDLLAADAPRPGLPDGTGFYVGIPLQSEEGYVLGALCVWGDAPRRIHERDLKSLSHLATLAVQQFEAALESAELHAARDRFNAIYERSADAYLIARDDRITHCNAAAVQLLGYADRRALQAAALSTLIGASTTGSSNAFFEAANQSSGRHFTWRVRPRVGGVRVVEASVNPITVEGQPASLIGMRDQTERLAAEAKLRESTERFSRAARGTADGLWDWELTTDAVWYAPRFYELLGYEDQAWPYTFEAWSDRIHPEDKAFVLDEVQAYLAQGEPFTRPYDISYRMRHRDGSYRWFHDRGSAMRDAERHPVRMSGAISDITERRENEAKLETSSRRLAFALEAANQGLWDWHIAEDTVYYSDRWYSMLGYVPNALPMTFATWESLVHPDDLGYAKQSIEDYVRGELPRYTCEIRMKNADGQWQWIQTVGEIIERDAQGQPTRMLGVHIDIDAAKQAQQQLMISEQRLRFALEASNTGLWDWNIVTGETYFNDTWYTMLGYEPGELPMHVDTWAAIAHPEDLTQATANIQDYLAGKTERYICEHRMRNKAGEWQWICDVGEVIERDDAGQPVRMVGVHLDIDGFKRSEQELAEARDAAEAANRSKSIFLANMSHEIRTPMNAILGYAALLDEPGQSPAQRGVCSETIQRNGRHLLTVINDVLDLSKIESGKVEIEHVVVSPMEIAEDVATLLRPDAESKGLKLRITQSPSTPAHVLSDPTRLRQILVNLVGNAVKFTAQGEVHLAIDYAPDPSQDTGELTFCVTDTGIGIAESDHERLFQPFVQADESTTRRFGGTGLGLTISRRLAEMLGGGLTSAATEDGGTRFTLALTVKRQHGAGVAQGDRQPPTHTSAAPAAPANPAARLSGYRVLVAEDGPDNQRLIRVLLQKAGADVVLADTGRDAINQIAADQAAGQTFDVVLMDMQMPELDGYAATRTLREQGYAQPIVALTAHAMAGDRERCLAAGCDSYLTKPVTRDVLVQGVADAKRR